MRYGLNMSEARNLQKWALEVSGAKRFLDTLSKLPKTKRIKLGLYVSYEIDVFDLEDDGLDYCTPTIASVLIVDQKEEMNEIGHIMTYNWETYWLYFEEDCEVDTAENWFGLIKKEYEKIMSGKTYFYSKGGK